VFCESEEGKKEFEEWKEKRLAERKEDEIAHILFSDSPPETALRLPPHQES